MIKLKLLLLKKTVYILFIFVSDVLIFVNKNNPLIRRYQSRKMDTLQKIYYLLVLFGLFSWSLAQTDTFDEELMLKPLPNGYVYAHFQFTTLWEVKNNINTCM